MALYTSVLTAGGNQFQTTSEHLNNIAKDFITPGVVGPIVNNTGSGGTGGYSINAQGTPNNTVAVTAGVAYITVTPSSQRSQVLRVEAQTIQTVTIAPNSTGSTRYDWIYIKVDATKAANPAVDSTDVSTLYTSRSTSNVSDNGTPPTYGLLLAVVTVANGFSTIANASILGKRTQAVYITDSITDGGVTTRKLKPSTINFADSVQGGNFTAGTSAGAWVDVTGITTTYTTGPTAERLFITGRCMILNTSNSNSAVTLSVGGTTQLPAFNFVNVAGQWGMASGLYIYDAPANTAVVIKMQYQTDQSTFTFHRTSTAYLATIKGFAISQ